MHGYFGKYIQDLVLITGIGKRLNHRRCPCVTALTQILKYYIIQARNLTIRAKNYIIHRSSKFLLDEILNSGIGTIDPLQKSVRTS